jgi:hypothetical protein
MTSIADDQDHCTRLNRQARFYDFLDHSSGSSRDRLPHCQGYSP